MADSEQFVGSHEKSFPGKGKGYGQNGDPSPSSVQIGKQPLIPSVSPPAASANAGDWQTRTLKGGNVNPDNVPPHDGMRSRNHEGGTVPSKTNHSPKR